MPDRQSTKSARVHIFMLFKGPNGDWLMKIFASFSDCVCLPSSANATINKVQENRMEPNPRDLASHAFFPLCEVNGTDERTNTWWG